MKQSRRSLFNNSFSHIYYEKEALNNSLSKTILQNFPEAIKVQIHHYKDFFCRSNQNFHLQKKSPKLILAVKKDSFLYQGSKMCENFNNAHFYYTSCIMNCIYNCDYCYLQGMYPSANIVVFVNIEDFFAEVDEALLKHPVYLCASYDTDLLSLENIVPFTSMWIEYAKNNPNLLIEIRTKSANYSAIRHIQPANNIILAWTISPNEVIQKYEQGTPSLNNRLLCINQAIEDGWKVRLCIDPILHIDHWEKIYRELIEKTFSIIPPEKVLDVSIGVFRISGEYLKRIKKIRRDSELLYYPFTCQNGIASYPDEIQQNLIRFVHQLISKYIIVDKIFL